MSPAPKCRTFIVALAMAWAYCAAALVTTSWLAVAAEGAAASSAHCRVVNACENAQSLGSGTLIDVTPDGQRGLVLTCAHLFREATGRVHVAFADGQSHGALLIALDHDADLAALEIARPRAAPASVNLESPRQGPFVACGFGGDGRFRCVEGRYAGEVATSGQTSLQTTGAVRSGDSGGGLFDARGNLTGVVWGQSEGVTYSSTGEPLRRFLSRVLGRRDGQTSPGRWPVATTRCPTGQCPRVQPQRRPPAVRPTPPNISGGGADPRIVAPHCECGNCPATTWGGKPEHDGQLSSAIGAVLSRIEALRRAMLASRFPLTASGPRAVALLIAAAAGGWLLLRRRSRARGTPRSRDRAATTSGDASSPDNSEATADAASTFRSAQRVEIQQPIERDDREAQQLLRLSQLEGRDPLQDAVAGRLALDRLDEIADGGGDSPRAGWADELRRELRERFNDVAPTKFAVSTAS